MKYDQSSRRLPDPPKGLGAESFAAPNELRDAHNFANKAQPIANLSVQAVTPPLNVDRPFERSAVAADSSIDKAKLPAKPKPKGPHFLQEARQFDADPPFRAPSSWLTQRPINSSQRSWNWSERSTAAFLGFATGVLIIVPLVIIISLTSDPATAPLPQPVNNVVTEAQSALIKLVAEKPASESKIKAHAVSVGSASASQWYDKHSPTRLSNALALALASARKALEAGRIANARAILRQAASPDRPQLWFVLAETYDPLAGRLAQDGATAAADKDGEKDSLRDADIQFARYYYQQALTHGIEAARARLQALPGP